MKAAKKTKAMKELKFRTWMIDVNTLIIKKQVQPLADYKKCKWRESKWKRIWGEGYTPKEAARLWGLAHERRK
jgi:hypothetical protein